MGANPWKRRCCHRRRRHHKSQPLSHDVYIISKYHQPMFTITNQNSLDHYPHHAMVMESASSHFLCAWAELANQVILTNVKGGFFFILFGHRDTIQANAPSIKLILVDILTLTNPLNNRYVNEKVLIKFLHDNQPFISLKIEKRYTPKI